LVAGHSAVVLRVLLEQRVFRIGDLANAISELERQRDAIDQALSALREIEAPTTTQSRSNNSAGKPTRKRWRISAVGKRNIIAALKKRWAAKRAAEASGASKPSRGSKPGPKRKVSATARKKMAEAAKKMWVARKKAQAA